MPIMSGQIGEVKRGSFKTLCDRGDFGIDGGATALEDFIFLPGLASPGPS